MVAKLRDGGKSFRRGAA